MISRDVSVAEAMSRDVRVGLLEMPIREAARLMAELDVGVLPVSDGGRLVGMLTDRDIAVRAVALGFGPDTPVNAVMTPGARYCHADDRLDQVLEGMGALQIRRMPVLDMEDRLVGIVSLADASTALTAEAGEALEDISEPGGTHSQADDSDPSGFVAPLDTLGDESGGSLLHFTDDEPS